MASVGSLRNPPRRSPRFQSSPEARIAVQCDAADLLEIYDRRLREHLKEEALSSAAFLSLLEDNSTGAQGPLREPQRRPSKRPRGDLSDEEGQAEDAGEVEEGETEEGELQDHNTDSNKQGWRAGSMQLPNVVEPLTSSAESTPAAPQSKRKRKRRGGSKHQKARATTASIKEENAATLAARFESLREAVPLEGVDMQKGASVTSTGWRGKQPLDALRKEVAAAWDSGRVHPSLHEFLRVPFVPGSKIPTVVLDAKGRKVLVRTSPCSFLADDPALAQELVEAFLELVKETVSDPSAKAKCREMARGPHFPAILGWCRAYRAAPVRTGWDSANRERCEHFVQKTIVKRFLGWITSVLRVHYPKVAERYQQCIDWHQKRNGFAAEFGLYFNLCVNAMFSGQSRIHCRPHADFKNIAGICIVFVYTIPGSNFDSTRYTWLVVWELGIVVELPPWVAVLYPSSLFFHFNIDVKAIRVVQTREKVAPTPTNSRDITNQEDRSSGRGSVVFFNQASMFQSSETGEDTLHRAREKGKSTTRDWSEDVEMFF